MAYGQCFSLYTNSYALGDALSDLVATVSVKVTDHSDNSTFEIKDEPVANVKDFIRRVESMVVYDSITGANYISIFFGIDFCDGEYDGFTRHYSDRRHIYTI